MNTVETGAGGREWTAGDARAWIAVPGDDDDKYSRGVLGVITGSDAFPGAAVLGVQAAMRTGVGMLRYLGAPRAAEFVLHRRPEVVTTQGRVQAWLIGSGMDADGRAAATDRIRAVMADAAPLVLDAGALDLVDDAGGPTIITPHYRELAKLLGAHDLPVSARDIAAAPREWAGRATRLLGVSVLLKGSTTILASPSGEPIRVALGTPWLATAGTGDVLGGILAALVATHAAACIQDPDATLSALGATAATVHGLAARRASTGGPIVALDVADAVPATIAALLNAEGDR